MMRSARRAAVLILVVLAAAPAAGLAAERSRAFGYQGFGPRVGLSIDPDQAFVGMHVDLGEAFPHVRFQPNAEIGFGDHATLLALDADFHFRFRESWDVWNPYVGGGLGLAEAWPEEGASRGDIVFHAVGGIERYISTGKFFLEAKLGLDDDAPDWKFLAGWTFTR
jgi:hypothetical protein